MPTKRVNKLVGKKTRNQVRDEALEQQHLRDEQLLDARAIQRSSTAGSDESADITVFEQAAETLDGHRAGDTRAHGPGRVEERVHRDHLAGQIQHRAAGVPRVDVHVGDDGAVPDA